MDGPTPLQIEIDPRFHPEHWRLARATCLRISGACSPKRPIVWMLRADGFEGIEAEQTWDWVSEEYVGADTDLEPFRCQIALERDPGLWQRAIDEVEVGGHVAIVAPLVTLCDARAWARIRSRPHTLIATGYRAGVALVTRGRWPADRQMRLVLI